MAQLSHKNMSVYMSTMGQLCWLKVTSVLPRLLSCLNIHLKYARSSFIASSATADWQSFLSALADYIDSRLLAPYNYH